MQLNINKNAHDLVTHFTIIHYNLKSKKYKSLLRNTLLEGFKEEDTKDIMVK